MPTVPPQLYPWYTVITGDELQQGDIFESCSIFIPRTVEGPRALFDWEERDVVLMSQSCDLVKGREKLEEVLLSALWYRSELPNSEHIATPKGLEEARKGYLPGFHLLAPSSEAGFERELRIVDFRRVYSLPISFVRQRAARQQRLRILPPYREQLSQAFARYFMRVGLPTDIPSFI